ncbi:MAG TPA: hypothetical protein VHD32_04655 [Candidatus Didemnitutus sp.]|nr:hypothetical protein [Candidatus Didemnitutus sp.]
MDALPLAGDKHPERGEWFELEIEPPRLTFVEVLLRDGRTQAAIYTGTNWWSTGTQLFPVGWRKLGDLSMN